MQSSTFKKILFICTLLPYQLISTHISVLKQKNKSFTIGIIGATGHVGYTSSYILSRSGLATCILLWGRNKKRCDGITQDIQEGIPKEIATKIYQASSQADIAAADIIVITAGEAAAKDQPRDELLAANMKMIASFIKSLSQSKHKNPNSVIIVVTNPVEDLTSYTMQLCEKYNYLHNPKKQIIGTGTLLDQKRTHLISNDKNLRVLGEHGEKLFIQWSNNKKNTYTPQQKKELEEKVKKKGYEILEKKGSTECGISQCLLEICTALRDGGELPVSVWDKEYEIVLSRPTCLGKSGAQSLPPLKLNKDELVKLSECIKKRNKMTQFMS